MSVLKYKLKKVLDYLINLKINKIYNIKSVLALGNIDFKS